MYKNREKVLSTKAGKLRWPLFVLLAMFGLHTTAEIDIYFIHNDHSGTPMAVTDVTQAVVWETQRKPFGETSTSGSIALDSRFPGQETDKESGYYYNYFRDYDPGVGRYLQSDPIGLRGGPNTYVYAVGNPLLYIDQYGLDAFLASRPTLAGANHMFIVYGADAQGNGGTVRSFGMQDGGKLGEVTLATSNFASGGTLQKDIDFWTTKAPGLVYTKIDASDSEVEKAADNLLTPWRYTLPPIDGWPIPTSGHLTMNSNTAAQAVANLAAGAPVPAPPGYHPGAENANLLKCR